MFKKTNAISVNMSCRSYSKSGLINMFMIIRYIVKVIIIKHLIVVL